MFCPKAKPKSKRKKKFGAKIHINPKSESQFLQSPCQTNSFRPSSSTTWSGVVFVYKLRLFTLLPVICSNKPHFTARRPFSLQPSIQLSIRVISELGFNLLFIFMVRGNRVPRRRVYLHSLLDQIYEVCLFCVYARGGPCYFDFVTIQFKIKVIWVFSMFFVFVFENSVRDRTINKSSIIFY